MKFINETIKGAVVQLSSNNRGIEGNVVIGDNRFRVLYNETLAVTKLTEAGRVNATEIEVESVLNIIGDIIPKFEKFYVVERCTACNKNVSEKVKVFSSGKFGKILCFDCQKSQPRLVSDSLAATCPPWLLKNN